MYETNLRMGLADPIPEFVTIVQEARYWNITPTELLNMPMEWVTAGRIVREAEAKAQQVMSKRHTR